MIINALYFSATGTTEKIVKRLADELANNNITMMKIILSINMN